MTAFRRYILILAPLGKDALLAARLLGRHRIETHICDSSTDLIARLDAQPAAVLITVEALLRADLEALSARLDAQPSWSDLPFIVLVRRQQRASRHPDLSRRLPRALRHVVYLEIPASGMSLVSAVESALSGRERQFRIRDELEAAAYANARLRAAEAELARSHEQLERLVAERTRALEESNSELKREAAERERAETALAHAQKMEAVGRLTGGIAHDFNNLLMALSGNLGLARHALAEGHPALRYVAHAQGASERGAKLAAQLLAFSRIQKLTLQPVHIDAVMGELLNLARHSLGPQHRFEADFEAPGRHVVADPNQMELAILNLVANARDAMPDGGTVRLHTSLHINDGSDAELSVGEYVEICVSDTGMGIAEDHLRQVFEPFFTTKPLGKGTGLGLAQVWGITHQCGGTVRVSSTPGVGTTFCLFFPVTHAAADAAHTPARPVEVSRARSSGEGLSVLVIDDDDNVRDALVGGLMVEEFNVRDASNGLDALPLINNSFPDALVVDFAMPGMNGATVARLAQKIRPDLPIVLITGYSDTAALDGVAHASVLTKPFPLEALRDLILRVVPIRA